MPDLDTPKRPCVLLADDDPLVRMCAADMFELLGFEVIEAGDGLQALALLCAHPDVALLFSDCRMPRMDGPTLASRAARLRPNLEIVLATGFTSIYPTAWPVLSKPYSYADVVRVIEQVLPGAVAAAV